MSDLAAEARIARERAYAPYSAYKVGAAIRDENGRVHVGCNVENVSYGATLCAERVALGSLIASGATQIRELALVTEDGGAPCGICLQVLAEFAAEPHHVAVRLFTNDQLVAEFWLADLLPHAFASKSVPRTERNPAFAHTEE